MKYTLTAREKKLLIGGSLFLILFLSIQFAILPLSKGLQEKKVEQEQLQMQKSMLEMKIASEDSIRQGYAKAKTSYEKLLQSYPYEMPNEEIDNLLTGLTRTTGLQPTKLTIADTVSLGLQEPAAQATEDKTKEDGKTGGEGEQAAPQTASVIRVSLGDMNFLGGYDTVKRLIDTVQQRPNVQLLRCTIQPSVERGTINSGIQMIAMVFEVSMLEQK